MSNTLAVYSLPFCCLLRQLFHHSHFLCSRTSVIMLLGCFLPVTCLAVFFVCLYPGFSTLPISLAVSSYPSPPTLSTCMLLFSLSSSSVTMQPETLSKPPVGNVGPQATVWCQHMCTWTLLPSLCVTLLWMPRHFVLPVTINSHIITRLNTSHLQAGGFYSLFCCTFLHSVCQLSHFLS